MRLTTNTGKAEEVEIIKPLPTGLRVAVIDMAVCTVGRQVHVAVIGPEPEVEMLRQPAMIFPCALKSTFPVWLTVATIELLRR